MADRPPATPAPAGQSSPDAHQSPPPGRLAEVAALFLRLGTIAFGGPAAHIAMMNDEVVRRRQWLDQQTFLDLLGATNLIPGPNSTEMAIHIGHRRAGWRGLIVAGTCFILPAMLIVMALAYVYVQYGALPQAVWLLYGIKPVIIAVVAQALWGLGRSAVKNWPTGVAGGAVVALNFLGWNEIALLFLAGAAVMLAANSARLRRGGLAALAWPFGPGAGAGGGAPGSAGAAAGAAGAGATAGTVATAAVAATVPATLWGLFLFFLKVGSVLYGSGYVLLAFLRADLVGRWGWLTSQQLLDAVAVGQFTPGPVFTTATFIGYVIAGWPGAVLATVGIFLPAFVFVAAVNPLVPRLRRSPWAGAFLDGVNAASLGIMAVVTWQLGFAALTDWLTVALAVFSLAALLRFRVNSAWLVLAGGAAGYAARFLHLTT